jgi:hypothetical protein
LDPKEQRELKEIKGQLVMLDEMVIMAERELKETLVQLVLEE